MVEQADAEKIPGLDQSLGDGNILLAGLWITARVIVHSDNARSRVDDGGSEDFPRLCCGRGYVV